MSLINGEVNGSTSSSQNWTDFCEQHAAGAAESFATEFRQYIAEHPAYNRPSTCQDFASKFCEYFLEHFEALTVLKHLTAEGGNTPHGSPTKSPKKRPPTLGLRSSTVELAEHGAVGGVDVVLHGGEGAELSPTSPKHKSFFRRFSFRGFKSTLTVNRPFKQLFKQLSDEIELSSPTYNDKKNKFTLPRSGEQKSKMTKMLVECKKEGIVQQLVGEDQNGQTKWEKCRLVLIKTTGGYMLEFYTPPKVFKPHHFLPLFL